MDDEQYNNTSAEPPADDDTDTTVVCDHCRRRLRIRFEARLAGEWPHCHGAAMRVQATSADPYQIATAGVRAGGRP